MTGHAGSVPAQRITGSGSGHCRAAKGNQSDFIVSVSNLPTGDLTVLDATYDYSVVKRNK